MQNVHQDSSQKVQKRFSVYSSNLLVDPAFQFSSGTSYFKKIPAALFQRCEETLNGFFMCTGLFFPCILSYVPLLFRNPA